jgi:phage-related protein
MGPLFTESAADYWWNTQHADGAFTAISEPEGWESVDYKLPLDEVGGRDGAFTGPQSVGPRQLECEALIVAPTAQVLRQHLASIRRIFGPQALPGPRQPVVWEQYDYDSMQRLALVTRPSGRLRFVVAPGPVPGGVAAVVGFVLVAANPPWKYRSGEVEFDEVGLLDPGLIQGRTYDKVYDYTYGTGTAVGGEMQVFNSGNLSAWPTFYVTGPVDFPIITNATTGQLFQINKNMIAGEQVVIDSRTGQVTPSGVRLIGRPFPLAPGNNTIRWRSQSGAYDPAALLRLEWRSTST